MWAWLMLPAVAPQAPRADGILDARASRHERQSPAYLSEVRG